MANPLADLDARIAALEARELRLDDLPLAELQRNLTDALLPDGDTFLLPKSIGASSLEDAITNGYLKLLTQANRKLALGRAAPVFAASANTPELTVAHGLTVAPINAICGVDDTSNVGGTAHRITAQITHSDATNIYIEAWSDAAVTGTIGVSWAAIA